MNRQVISARGISKVFYNQNSSLEVLKDISFDLDKGQSIGIVGASGSGKTTLLHIVCGLENPNSGEVLVNGKEISSLSFDEKALLRSKEIGFVYQFHHLLPDLTALENVLMPAFLRTAGKTILFCEIIGLILEIWFCPGLMLKASRSDCEVWVWVEKTFSNFKNPTFCFSNSVSFGVVSRG